MTDRKLKRPRDPNQLAKLMVDIATGEKEEAEPVSKDEGAIQSGREGGKKRARNLTPSQRSEIAQKAARARWRKS